MACANTRPSEIDVINLVGTDNGEVLTQEDVRVVDTEVTTENDRNTKATVEAQPEFTHGGKVQIFYDRWDLKKLFGAATIYVGTVDPASAADVICAVNAEYGTALPVEEMTVVKVNDRLARITAKVDSNGYIGQVEANVASVRVPLNERLTATLLKGFMYPNNDRPSLNNPVFIKDSIPELAQAWAGTDARDNRMGYDDIYNGELHLGTRWASVNGGWNAVRFPIGKRYGMPGETPRQMTTWRASSGNTGQSTGWAVNLLLAYPGKTISQLLAEYDITVALVSRPSANGASVTNVYKASLNAATNRVDFNRISGTTGLAVFSGPVGAAAFTGNYVFQLSGTYHYFPGLVEQRALNGGSYTYWYTGFGETIVTATRKAGGAKTVTFTSQFQGI